MQKVYQGDEAYAFISYSHKDDQRVHELIARLMLCSCNIWYDMGIHSGSDWSDEIATRLAGATCVLLFVTQNSINSEYVKDEINFAKTRHIPVYPIFLEDVKLPIGMELLIGRSQFISVNDNDVEGDDFKLREKILANLPKEVFNSVGDPFYASKNNTFYLKDETETFPDGTYFAGEDWEKVSVISKHTLTGEYTTLYTLSPRPAYDMKYSLNNVSKFDDPYFCDDNSQILFLSFALTFIAKYPAPWPDLDLVLTLCITDLESDRPQMRFISCKCATPIDEKHSEFVAGLIDEIQRSFVKTK